MRREHAEGLTMEDKAIYTTKEAADYLGVSPSTIYRVEKRGFLFPAKTSARQRRFGQKEWDTLYRSLWNYRDDV